MLKRAVVLFLSAYLSLIAPAWAQASVQSPITLTLSMDIQRLAHDAARIFQEEAHQAIEEGYRVVMVVPTGRTAVPFYQQLVRLFFSGELDFSAVELFNMDEYVGYAPMDPQQMEESYEHFMEQHFYQFVRNKVHGLPDERLHIPRFVYSVDEADLAAEEYRRALKQALAGPDTRLVVFGGIGANPAHIAFNDLTTESFYQDKLLTDLEKTQKAKALPTRVVALDSKTMEANNVAFTHAITIGFEEVLNADRVVIMANTVSKRRAIKDAMTSSPSYKVPASLLQCATGKVEFMITPQVYDNEDPLFPQALGIERGIGKTSLLSYQIPNISSLTPNPNKRALFVRYDDDTDWPEYWVKQYPNHYRVTLSKTAPLYAALEAYEPAVVILPEPYDEQTRTLDQQLKKRFIDNKGIWGESLAIYFDTPDSLLARYNFWYPLDEHLMDRFEMARNYHVSQVRRTAFAQIPKKQAEELLQLARGKIAQFPGAMGLEAYRVSRFEEGELILSNDFDIERFNEKDQLVLIAPHPDDVEIGAAGLITAFAQTPKAVWNMTGGHHLRLDVQDVIDNMGQPFAMRKQVKAMQEKGEHFIDDLNMRKAIRQNESRKAIAHIAGEAFLPPELKALDLPVYDHDYTLSVEDHNRVMQMLNALPAVRQLVVALPFADDAHRAHQVSREVTLDALRQWQAQHVDTPVMIVEYPTPWTGDYNLYHYDDQGLSSAGIIGTERLPGKGASGHDFAPQLPSEKAHRYQLQRLG